MSVSQAHTRAADRRRAARRAAGGATRGGRLHKSLRRISSAEPRVGGWVAAAATVEAGGWLFDSKHWPQAVRKLKGVDAPRRNPTCNSTMRFLSRRISREEVAQPPLQQGIGAPNEEPHAQPGAHIPHPRAAEAEAATPAARRRGGGKRSNCFLQQTLCRTF